MISWMQKNNKYLVITIWIATIAFIGAGFVGWGSVKFGTGSSSVAKVGDISISKIKFGFEYNNLYAQYAKKFGNKFDKKLAEKLGLQKQVFNNLVQEALLLNMAKEYGIVVTDEEIGEKIVSYPLFQNKNGKFEKSIYESFLKSRGLRAKDFESILKDETAVRKLSKLIFIKPLKFEKEVLASSFNIADKIKYTVLKLSDVNVTVNENEVKKYWEKNKLNYLTDKKYDLELLWTDSKDVNVTQSEIEKYYKENSFNYLNDKGEVKALKNVKDRVVKDLKLSKIKKLAAIARSRFKKGKIAASENVVLKENDSKFNSKIWQAIKEAKTGEYLKPKIVGNKYVTIHLKAIEEPKEMSFEQAKDMAVKDYKIEKAKEELYKLAENKMKNSASFNLESKGYITPSKFEVLPSLTPQESMKVIKGVFGSNKELDKVDIGNGIVVYKIQEQKMLDNNTSNEILNKEITAIKENELYSNLINKLSKKYKLVSYVKDLK